MLQQILVPLDGSTESEKALAVGEQLAREQGARVVLLQAVEPFTWVDSVEVYKDVIDKTMQEVEASLAKRAELLRARSVAAETVVILGSPAATILDYEAAHPPDLVVMATHGRSGLARFALGSVSDRVVREGGAPVLVIRRSSTVGGSLGHALVLLDGSGLAEQALPMVEALAGKPITRVTLFRVVADPRDRTPAATYLEEVAARLSKSGLDTQALVDTGSVASVVERAARATDLVVLCTHGRGGFDRLRHGSVAEHVAREVDKPILLVRASA